MKRKYEFRLARLMRVRSIQEEVARAEWAAAQALATEAETQVAERTEKLRQDRQKLAGELASGASGALVLSRHATLDSQILALQEATTRATAARSKAEDLVLVWRKREQERRSLSELAQRGLQRHRIELEREEEASRDAIFQGRRHGDSQGDSSAGLPQADGSGREGQALPQANPLASHTLLADHQAP